MSRILTLLVEIRPHIYWHTRATESPNSPDDYAVDATPPGFANALAVDLVEYQLRESIVPTFWSTSIFHIFMRMERVMFRRADHFREWLKSHGEQAIQNLRLLKIFGWAHL
jgi:hypothetical protein